MAGALNFTKEVQAESQSQSQSQPFLIEFKNARVSTAADNNPSKLIFDFVITETGPNPVGQLEIGEDANDPANGRHWGAIGFWYQYTPGSNFKCGWVVTGFAGLGMTSSQQEAFAAEQNLTAEWSIHKDYYKRQHPLYTKVIKTFSDIPAKFRDGTSGDNRYAFCLVVSRHDKSDITANNLIFTLDKDKDALISTQSGLEISSDALVGEGEDTAEEEEEAKEEEEEETEEEAEEEEKETEGSKAGKTGQVTDTAGRTSDAPALSISVILSILAIGTVGGLLTWYHLSQKRKDQNHPRNQLF